MSVLFPFVGDTIGGSHLATIALIKKLSARETQTHVVLHQKGPLAELLDKEHISYEVISFPPVETGPLPAQIAKAIRAGVYLFPWLKKEKITVVHTNDLRMHYTWFLAAKMAGCRHIWHQHSHAPSPRLWLYMAFPNKILTISEYTRTALPSIYRHKTMVIYNHFELPDATYQDRKKYHQALSAELGISEDTKIIGFVGNLTAQKRPDFFLHMAAHYGRIENAPPAYFVLIGAPRAEMQDIVNLKLNSPVLKGRATYIGAKFPVENYIAGFDALVAPSLREGLGRVPIEAMLLKTPVLASDHGGHREIIQHGMTGILFAPDNAAAAAQDLANMLCEPVKLEKRSFEAYDYACRQFTSHAYLQKIIDAYAE
ncbi:MAG TPA: glycosyltransferase family 4 protein [Micavibrio sp.]|nr:glycosyltransferase family 4 protein [Micavibrio sp.]